LFIGVFRVIRGSACRLRNYRLSQPSMEANVLGTAKLITLEAAKNMAAAGEAEARKNGWNVAIAVVDASGGLILFHKLDETQPGSIAVAQGKARAAALFKRPSKAMEEAIAGGKQAFLTIEGIVPMQGGLPVIVEGKVIGAVGVSGVTSAQDEQVAQAALSGLGG
jgi:glc operon protein GlcG